MVTFINDYSKWCKVYFLKRKDEILNAFQTFKKYTERQIGQKIKYLQSDNGRKYYNRSFNSFLRNECIDVFQFLIHPSRMG